MFDRRSIKLHTRLCASPNITGFGSAAAYVDIRNLSSSSMIAASVPGPCGRLKWVLLSALLAGVVLQIWLLAKPLSAANVTEVASAHLKVLLVRTVGQSEWRSVQADIRSLARKSLSIHSANTSHCLTNFTTLYRSQTLDGFSTELPPDLWPTHLLCRDSSVKKLTVELHVLLIVYDVYVTDTVLSYLQRAVKELNLTVVRSTGSRKLGAWFKHLTPSTVSNYDYIWLADGDVKVSAINWFSFWAHMLYFKPLIAQPSIIGHLEKFQDLPRGSDHPILNLPFDKRTNVWNTDVTLIAAEVGIVEMMAAVLTAETWLAVRSDLAANSKVMELIAKGATWCIDTKWCEVAQGLRGSGIREADVAVGAEAKELYRERNYSYGPGPGERRWRDLSALPACVVFYQTPVIHQNRQTLDKSGFTHINKELCSELPSGVPNIARRAFRAFYQSDFEVS